MLSFFPLDVLDETWDVIEILRDFLPTLLHFHAMCHSNTPLMVNELIKSTDCEATAMLP